MTKPHIVIIGTGGTIVSSGTSGAQMTGYSIQGLDVRSIISAVPALAEIANIDAPASSGTLGQATSSFQIG